MKQKIIKTLFLPLLVAGLSLAYLSAQVSQNYVPAVQLPQAYSCTTESKLYLDEDNDGDGVPDYFLYLRSNFRYPLSNPPSWALSQIMQFADPNNMDGTRVGYRMSHPNVLQKQVGNNFSPIDNQTFIRMSQTFPYNTRVRGIDTNDVKIIFERPIVTGASNLVSIVYNYRYRTAIGFANGNKTRWYNPVASGGDFGGLSPSQIITWTSTTDRVRTGVSTAVACINYRLHRCGDGVVNIYAPGTGWANQFTGEVCDDGPLNGQPGYCNIDCSGTGGAFFCGDGIINDGSFNIPTLSGGLRYGPTYFSGGMEIQELCDEGDDNGPDYTTAYCNSFFCEPNTEPESFPEELG